MKFFLLVSLALLALKTNAEEVKTIAEALQDIYHKCSSSDAIFSCAKPKVLSYFSAAAKRDKVFVTPDLTLVRTSIDPEGDPAQTPSNPRFPRSKMLEKLDAFLGTHRIEVRLPEEILRSNIVPGSMLDSVPRSIAVPLAEPSNVQGRGFVKKVMMPFLLGLKFKATALVPLALALIALKTWKALTLGLLSIVLSGAMLIFKFTKPKVAYEVVHYGHPPVEHPPHWETSPNGPYRGYRK